jgi:hypothetical protein
MAKQANKIRRFEVRDFERSQYRSDRPLPWIKLETKLLDDPDFERLPDEAKFWYVGLLLLRRKLGELLPFDAQYLTRKISASRELDLELLLEAGFIFFPRRQTAQPKPQKVKGLIGAQTASNGRHVCAPDIEGEEIESRGRGERGDVSSLTGGEARCAAPVLPHHSEDFFDDDEMPY